uniref:Uncharacterized protein n=1 Tax=viral metagenome TaxID=1070528 RepID=A0A6C0JEA3_9ZZZZ
MNKNVFLTFMIICYLLLIMFVYYNYTSNNTVSNVICDNKCKYYILFFMFLMGIGTLLYELERNDKYSQIIICVLLIGIYGLIYFNETHTIHYYFAFLVFIDILFFMIRHCYLTNCNVILMSSLYLEFFTLFYILININDNIFYGEIIYILNFAFYYLYLHFIQ